MSSRISSWLGLIGIAATIPLVQPHIASAKTPVEIAKTARAITVLITEPDNVGSRVIIQRQGDIYIVLTAAHVVKNKGKVAYKITTPDDRKYDIISSSIRSAPGSIDLAVVKFKSTTNYPTAKLGNCNILESGMDLFVSGFPAATRTINESVFVFREGKVTANSNKTFEKGYSLIYSNDTLPGMSGGAVLNNDKLNDVQGALADYNQAIALNPNDAQAYNNRGILKNDRLNDIQGAISDMQQALKLYQQQGKQQDAQNAIDQIKKWQQTSNNSRF